MPFSMLLPSLQMTTEMSWLVKISPNGSTNYESLTHIRNSHNSVTTKESSVEFPIAVLLCILQYCLKVCDENSEVHGSNTVPS